MKRKIMYINATILLLLIVYFINKVNFKAIMNPKILATPEVYGAAIQSLAGFCAVVVTYIVYRLTRTSQLSDKIYEKKMNIYADVQSYMFKLIKEFEDNDNKNEDNDNKNNEQISALWREFNNKLESNYRLFLSNDEYGIIKYWLVLFDAMKRDTIFEAKSKKKKFTKILNGKKEIKKELEYVHSLILNMMRQNLGIEKLSKTLHREIDVKLEYSLEEYIKREKSHDLKSRIKLLFSPVKRKA